MWRKSSANVTKIKKPSQKPNLVSDNPWQKNFSASCKEAQWVSKSLTILYWLCVWWELHTMNLIVSDAPCRKIGLAYLNPALIRFKEHKRSSRPRCHLSLTFITLTWHYVHIHSFAGVRGECYDYLTERKISRSCSETSQIKC